MKLTSIVLVFLFTGLNFWPCEDTIVEDSCSSEVHFHDSNNQESNSDSDHCSPFCQCYCCHVQVENVKPIILSSEVSFLSLKRRFFLNHTGQGFINPLFEPPQV